MSRISDDLPIVIIIKRAESASELTASPRALEWAEKLSSIGARDITELTPVEAREEDERTSLPFLTKPEPVEKIENHKIRDGLSEIPVRVYWPKSTGDEQDMYPIIVYFHGGGWVVGKVELFDELCSMLANRSESIVISVNYRLAPESKFPAGLHDCYSVTKWAADNAEFLDGDRDTIIVGGDSAGGNLATAVSLMAKERNGPQIAAQILIYPVTDLTIDMSKYSKDRFGPSKEAMEWFGREYVKHDSETKDPLVSPQYGDLHGLPPAVVVTAECDPLREQDLEYVKKLEQSGVKTKLLDYPGMVHGFVQLPGYFQEGREAIEKIASEIRSLYVENEM